MITITKSPTGTTVVATPTYWSQHNVGGFEFTASFGEANEPFGNELNAVSVLLEALLELQQEAKARYAELAAHSTAEQLIRDVGDRSEIDLGAMLEEERNEWRSRWAAIIDRMHL